MKSKVNKYGVKVGDLFAATWGYDQTNVSFFQVVSLCGESSVRVRQVDPPLIEENPVGWLSSDRTYRKPDNLLPPRKHSIFIDNQEKGDLKRLKSYKQDNSDPLFVLTSYCDAHLVTTDTIKTYESWYA